MKNPIIRLTLAFVGIFLLSWALSFIAFGALYYFAVFMLNTLQSEPLLAVSILALGSAGYFTTKIALSVLVSLGGRE